MTTPTKLADLPNAVHIDAVLAHLKANPDKWDALATLVAYDHAGDYMGMDLKTLQVTYALTEDPAALLMQTAAIAMKEN